MLLGFTEIKVYIKCWFDKKAFNRKTFSSDYESTEGPNIIQSEKGIPILFYNYFYEIQRIVSNHAPLQKVGKREIKFQKKHLIISIKNKLFDKYLNVKIL